MKLQTDILRYKFIFVGKEISFCNVLLICEKHYTSSILVTIMDLIQLFSRILTPKALV